MEYIALRQLRELKQTGIVQEYVKKFFRFMLGIRDMFEMEKLFYFLEGLKPRVRTKLQGQRIQDLASAQTLIEHLTNYIFDEFSCRKSQLYSKPFKQN